MNYKAMYERITQKWKMDEATYPILLKLPLAFWRHFKINHIVQHQIKATNRVIALLEDEEHEPLDPVITINPPYKDEILEAVWRMQVNLIQLANIAGIKHWEIENKLEKYLEENK
jgi:hypothetical protein